LRRKLPELYYLDAIVGFLQTRMGNNQPEKTAHLITTALAQYRDAAASISPSLPAAVASALGGIVDLQAYQRNHKSEEILSAQRQFTEAVSLALYSAETRNLAAMAAALACCNSSEGFRAIAPVIRQLEQSIAADPLNADALANMGTLYNAMLATGKWPVEFKQDAIETRRALIKNVRNPQINPARKTY
jgi:hypothetical protein